MPVEAFHIEEAAAAGPGAQPARKLTWCHAGLLIGVFVIIFTALRHRSNLSGAVRQEGNSQDLLSPNLRGPADQTRDESRDASINTSNGGLAGGWLQVTGPELAPGSHIASLAAYAIDAIKGQSNSLEFQNMTFGHVVQANRQIVNGINNRIVVQLLPQGTATLDIFEQRWTNTLTVFAAHYSPLNVGPVRIELITGALTLDSEGLGANRSNALRGGWSPVSGSELAPGSRIASLAAYALRAVKEQSNSMELQNITFGHVLRASRQLVNGINIQIIIQLLPQGTATLDIFEQAWTNTLEVSAARYSPSDVSFVQIQLLKKALVLDPNRLGENRMQHTNGGDLSISKSE